MKINLKGMQKKAKKAVGQLGKQVKPAVQGMLKNPKRMQGLVKGAQGLIGGKMNFGSLRNQLMGQKSPVQSVAPVQPPMASAPSTPPQLPKPAVSALPPMQAPLAPEPSKSMGPAQQEQEMKTRLMPNNIIPKQDLLQGGSKQQSQADQSQQEAPQSALPAGQQPQNVAPMGQPPQGAEAPAQDSGALDQQIAALQKQIADLQAQKK